MSKTAKTDYAGGCYAPARLILRQARPDDLKDLHAVYGDPRAMRYWSTLPHADLSETAAWLAHLVDAAPGPTRYFVVDRDGRAIGTAGMHQDYEIGFILHPDHWRQGLGREILNALIPYLFDVTDAGALTADTDPRNTGSMALLTAAGFRETGRAERTFCVGGEWSDSVYFRLDRGGPNA
ncbi:MAG: GNAT family protein [Pseudomonadota bacterium]